MELTEDLQPVKRAKSKTENVTKPGDRLCESCDCITNDVVEILGPNTCAALCGNCGARRPIALFEVPNGTDKKELNTVRNNASLDASSSASISAKPSKSIDGLRKELSDLEAHIENVGVYRARVKVLRKALKTLESL